MANSRAERSLSSSLFDMPKKMPFMAAKQTMLEACTLSIRLFSSVSPLAGSCKYLHVSLRGRPELTRFKPKRAVLSSSRYLNSFTVIFSFVGSMPPESCCAMLRIMLMVDAADSDLLSLVVPSTSADAS